MIAARSSEATIGRFDPTVLETAPESVFAHAFAASNGTVAFAHNLAEERVTATLDVGSGETAVDALLGTADLGPSTEDGVELALGRYGYQWLRIEEERERLGN